MMMPPLTMRGRRKSYHKSRPGSRRVTGLSGEVIRQLVAYDWPGNVCELRNFVETMVVIDMDGTLDVDDLPDELGRSSISPPPATSQPSDLVGRPLSEVERWAIEQTLQLTGGNREETARMLGIGSRRIQEIGF